MDDTRPLKLFWWNGEPNFGDRLSADIVASVSGRTVEWAPPEDAELFSIGSIMRFVRKACTGANIRRPWLWGTGSIGPIRTDFVPNVRIASLRGPLSYEMLRLSHGPVGDPGLLVADVVDRLPARGDTIGILPHHSLLKRRSAESLKTIPNSQVIDPRNPNHLDVVRQIAGCRLIASSSLHGLVVADALGIPSVWLDPHRNHEFARFKFYDYAASIGRPLGRPLRLKDVEQLLKENAIPNVTYMAGVRAAQKELRASFPSELSAARTETEIEI